VTFEHHEPLVRRLANTAYVAALMPFERRVPRLDPAWIERLQRSRVRSIVRHAYATVPFYREAMDELGLGPENLRCADDLSRLPLIDPVAVRSDVERFTSEALGPDDREELGTSGTASTIRGVVYWDNRHVLRSLAKAERDRSVLASLVAERHAASALRELAGASLRSTALGRLAGAGGEHQRISIFPADLAARVTRTRWSERTLIPARSAHHHYFPAFLPFDEAVHHFNRIRPRIVFSFGSYAEQFLRYVAERPGQVSLPRVWVYGGDAVTGAGWELADSLGCCLYSVYSAVEADRIGFQCELRQGHHLNVDMCSVRLVDARGRDVPAGEPGEVVISNLWNRATVLLNYRLGDRATMAVEPCPCGRTLPVLEELHGRVSDVVRLADGRELSELVLDGMFRPELDDTLKAQISQPTPGRLRWSIVPMPGVDAEALKTSLLQKARARLGDDTVVELEFVDDIGRTARGKFARVSPSPAASE
jgi:phenylacetate-CoA ligase